MTNLNKHYKEFKDFLAEKCWDEKAYGDGKYDKKIFNFVYEQGRKDMKEEIESKLPKRKGENKKKKDVCEWINIPRIQRAVGFNSCLQLIKQIIEKI